MRLFPITAIAILFMAGCQTTTAPATQTGSPQKVSQSKCSEVEAKEYAHISQRVAELEKETARGYRTNPKVVRVANPLKLCKGVVPLVSVCLPTPKPTSILPTYQDYQAMRKELDSLKARQATLAACAAA